MEKKIPARTDEQLEKIAYTDYKSFFLSTLYKNKLPLVDSFYCFKTLHS